MDLSPDFDEFFGSLLADRVAFLVVGAYAVALHGCPRYTGDLDILVEPTHENVARLVAAIDRFGFPTAAINRDGLVAGDSILELGVPPVQIHVMTRISGVGWPQAHAACLVVRLGTHDVPVIGRTALLANKRAAGRPKDLADVAALEGTPPRVD